MLGKGLESLIPPQKGSAAQGAPAPTPGGSAPAAGTPTAQGAAAPAQSGGAPASTPAPSGMPAGGMLAAQGAPTTVVPAARNASASSATAAASQSSPQSSSQPLPAALPHHQSAVFHIEVDKISPNPHQPRKHFDEEGIRELAASIREFGILQPLVVSKVEEETATGIGVRYELIAGERRLLAAKMLGLERVPAIVREVDTAHERLEMAVIENIQRENLNPVELARAFARLQDEFRLTQREIATRLGKSREVVANTLRLLDLPTYIQEAVGRGEITESHGRLLLAVPDPEAQKKLFEDLLGHRMTTRELRLRVESMKPVKKEPPPSPEIAAVEEKLSSELGAPVKISGGEAGGKITIIFYSAEELRQIAERLGKEKKLEEAG